MNNLFYPYNWIWHIEFKSQKQWNPPCEEKAMWRWRGHSKKGMTHVFHNCATQEEIQNKGDIVPSSRNFQSCRRGRQCKATNTMQ